MDTTQCMLNIPILTLIIDFSVNLTLRYPCNWGVPQQDSNAHGSVQRVGMHHSETGVQGTASAFLHTSNHLSSGSLLAEIWLALHLRLESERSHHQDLYVEEDKECSLLHRPAAGFSHLFRIQCSDFCGMECHASYLEAPCANEAGHQITPAFSLTLKKPWRIPAIIGWINSKQHTRFLMDEAMY